MADQVIDTSQPREGASRLSRRSWIGGILPVASSGPGEGYVPPSNIVKIAFSAAFASSFLACGASPEPRSSISTTTNGLRTFSVIREINGSPVTCGMVNVPSHVRGVLRGDPGNTRETVWLEDEGRRLSVVWPEGFAVRFEPEAVLYNEKGVAVARAGELTELTQVAKESAAGTFDEPYVASCWLFGEVYVYKP